MRHSAWLLLGVAACGGAKVVPPRAPAASAACAKPEHRQFDFWVGDWDLVIRARTAPDKDEWAEAKGRQKIESILGGCVISEHFTGEGPGQPWAGNSYSMWQPQLGKWRQSWVDDSGSFIALTGGVEDGTMYLYGEPIERNGKRTQMRMAFREVTRDSIRWEWEGSVDDGATWTPSLVILYRRR